MTPQRLCAAVTVLALAGAAVLRGACVDPGPCLLQALKQEYSQRQGTAVVLSVESGAVLAAWRLEVAGRRVLLPGSALKPFTLAALFERRAITPATSYRCPGRFRAGGMVLECPHPDTGAPFSAVEALAYSCNGFFGKWIERLGPGDLSAAARRLGLISFTGLAAGEVVGNFRTPSTPEEKVFQGLGVAGSQVTPLGMLQGYRHLARWLKATGEEDAAARTLRAGLESCVRFGTGQAAAVEGLEVAGKTGTARQPGNSWTHAWFAGFFPASRPEVVFVFLVEAGAGARDAAPIAGAVLRACREPLLAACKAQGLKRQGRGRAWPRGLPK